MMNTTPIWTAQDIQGIQSPLNSSIQLPTFKVNVDTESVRSGYSDRSKRSRGHASHSVTHSASNNVLIGNHMNHVNHMNNHLSGNHINHVNHINNNHSLYGNHNSHRSHNHTSGHHSYRSSSRHSHRSTRSDRAFVSKLESPDERHEGRPEVIEVQILPQDDNWGDNTTAITGNTSDHSVSAEDINKIGKDLWREQSFLFRCQMWSGSVVTAFLSFCAFISPILMVVLPKVDALEWKTLECGPECDGLLISFAFKLLILLVGSWAIFVRKPRATMPRIFVYRAVVMALVFVFIVSYWLFYLVRIAEKRFNDYDLVSYHSIVQFAVSLVDALLFIHYLAVVLIEIRHLQPQYYIKVVRSPDGKSRSYNSGQLSIQRAAVWILEKYYKDFDIYNPYLESLPSRKSRKSSVNSNHINSTTAAIKYYDIEGITSAPNNNSQSLAGSTSMGINMTNNNRFMNGINGNSDLRNRRDRDRDRGDTSSHHHSHHHHNERFYEEHEYERRVRKRRARLITATEDAFTHIKRVQEDRGPAIPMDPKEAAQSIFPSLVRSLQKYLRITRQQPRHSMQSILDHLALCLSFDLSPKAFLEKYLVSSPVLQSDNERKPLQTWSLVCDIMLSRKIQTGTVFMLRQGDISLLVSVHELPHFNIVEEVIDPKSNKFVFRLNSETSV
ncbi:vang-like protein 2 [Oppia nitens]|uniref:vang-like protein 2 n=1 Tax=Oppia nitens TaxID=1686743 RepID=UPI0023DBDC39|nr:vang-like protein 2 [Oppia nitens]XP_054168764.1 vang-like protein 2 [Oppia nitens]XP_054168765.1 vang-like protein 2 [Oppia nitens]